MEMNATQHPTDGELVQFSIKAKVCAVVRLTPADSRGYILLKCLKTRISSGMSPRQSVAFFTPHGFTSMGAVGQKYNTRKRNVTPSVSGIFYAPWFSFYGRGGAKIQYPQGEYCPPGCLQVFNTRAHQFA